METKEKSQRFKSERLGPLASMSVASWQSGLMHLTYNLANGDLTAVPSVRIGHSPLSNNAPSVVRATSGAILRPKPKDEVVGPVVILARLPEESKRQNDVPQLRDTDGQGREIRQESDSEIPLQEMREAIQ